MLPFIKMNGSGNDFIIFDARNQSLNLTKEQVLKVSDRDNTTTEGCDQVIVLEPSNEADVFMRIFNADGSEINACGNATRCIAYLLDKELNKMPVTIETKAGIMIGVEEIELGGGHLMLVDMGKPKLQWQDIPLAMPLDQALAKVAERGKPFGNLSKPAFVNMGNPHVIFFQEFSPNGYTANPGVVINADIEGIGKTFENALEIFPERVNVTIASLFLDQYSPENSGYRIIARVWERGAGQTAACGTAACAMLVAANQLNPAIRKATVEFVNSDQDVNVLFDAEGHVLLAGLVQEEFRGNIEL